MNIRQIRNGWIIAYPVDQQEEFYPTADALLARLEELLTTANANVMPITPLS